MEVPEHIDALESQGRLLADAAQSSELEAPVPTCNGWALRDLLDHTGDVHRWANNYIATGREDMMSDEEEKAFFSAHPTDKDELIAWFREGHEMLCTSLRNAPPTLSSWAFFAAPSALAFWARRQAHETTVHRFDAESVRGDFSPLDPELASDGIDELLTGFASRGRKLLRDEPETLAIAAHDTGERWFVTLGTDKVIVESAVSESRFSDAQCVVSGDAADVYLTLWNRLPQSSVSTRNDASVLAGFCENLQIRWS
jgi:uncharacterized protein (TIGR03083 family)